MIKKITGRRVIFFLKITGKTLFLEPKKPRGGDIFESKMTGYILFCLVFYFLVFNISYTYLSMSSHSIFNKSLYESLLHLEQLPVLALTPSITTHCMSPLSICNNSLDESSLYL